MKKLLTILVLMLMLVGCGGQKSYASHLDKVKETNELIIATEGLWEPWTYTDENGKLIGFDVEIGEKIAEKLGVKVNFVTGDFTGFLTGLDNGQYDLVINGIDITEERKAKYDFSDTYAYSVMYLIVAEDNQDINSLDDLNGKKITNSAGSSYAKLGEDNGAKNIGGDTFDITIENILNGYADASINSADTYGMYISKHPDAKVKVVQKIDPLDVAIPFVKGEYNDTFRTEINKILKDMRDSGELKELSIKYFGQDITVK